MNMNFSNILRAGSTLVLALAAGGPAAAAGSEVGLPLPDIREPQTGYTFPGSFASFNLEEVAADVSVGTSAPAIAEWIKQNDPGDTMVLSGHQLTLQDGSAAWEDTEFVVFGEDGSGGVQGSGEIVLYDDYRVAVTLPTDLPENTMWMLWPKNADSYGEPVAINRAESWWVGPEKVRRNESFAVYGRELVADKENPVAYVYIKELDRWLTTTNANPFRAEFDIPEDLENGTYTLWPHNGTGDKYGWAEPLSLTVIDGFDWNDDSSTWINVKDDYGAKGDGSTDDYQAIINALSACPSGGTVYFPAGTYLTAKSIWNIGANKRVLGAGADLSMIKRHSSYDGSISAGLVSGVLSSVEIKDISFSTSTSYSAQLFYIRKSADVLFSGVRFTELVYTGTSWSFVDMHASDNLAFEDCEFITTAGLFLGNASQLRFSGCQFRGIDDCNGMVYQKGGQDVSFINCTAQPYDSTDETGDGWAKGRWIVGSGGWGAMRNIYFGGNRTTDMMPRESTAAAPVDQNSGEQFLYEALTSEYRGVPTSATSNTVSFSDLSSSYEGLIISVVGGKGIGQNRTVESFDSGSSTVTVDSSWRVVPDSTSTIIIGQFMSRMAVYGNYFDGMERAMSTAASDITASAGVSAYGGCSDLVVADNTFHQLTTAIYNWSRGEPTAEGSDNIVMQPNHFNLFTDNTISNCRRGMVNMAAIDKDMTVEQDIGLLGNVFRDNTIEDISEWAVAMVVSDDQLLLDMTVYDQNVITNAAEDVYEVAPVYNQVWIEPSFSSEPTDPTDPPAAVLTGIAISGASSVDEGATSQFTCTGSYSDGTEAVVDAVWSVSSDDASIDGAGLLTAGDVAEDVEILITAAVDGFTATSSVTILFAAPILSDIEIEGASVVTEGDSAQYTCYGNYTDGSRVEVTPSWSIDSSAASITATGLLTAGDIDADQSVALQASFGGKTASLEIALEWIPPTLASLTVSGAVSLDEGSTASYSCIGTYSDGTTAVVTPAWSVNSASASIDENGILTAGDVDADEVVTITALLSGLTDEHPVVINYVAPHITSIGISGSLAVNEGSSAQYSCTAVYSDGSEKTVFPGWSVSGSGTISDSGLLTTVDVTADSTAVITASYEGFSDSLTVAVNYVAPAVESLEITGPQYVDEETSTADYDCAAYYSDGTSAEVEPVWEVTSEYASISEDGLLTTGDVIEDQTIEITAYVDDVSAAYAVEILYVAPAVTVGSIMISAPTGVYELEETNLTCSVVYSDGSSEEVEADWSVSGKASITSNGALTGGNVEEDQVVSVTASYDGYEDTADVTIWAVGNQIIYPMTGFAGKNVRASLFDAATGESHDLGEMTAPDELVIQNVTADRWYYVTIEEYDDGLGDWQGVHGNWVRM